MRREPAEDLIPLDPEIERSLKRILRDKREAARMEQLPMGLMEENRDDDIGSTRGGSIHPDAANMDNMLPSIRDYGLPSAVTPPVIRRPAINTSEQLRAQVHHPLVTARNPVPRARTCEPECSYP